MTLQKVLIGLFMLSILSVKRIEEKEIRVLKQIEIGYIANIKEDLQTRNYGVLYRRK